jgi:hypothetical protein
MLRRGVRGRDSSGDTSLAARKHCMKIYITAVVFGEGLAHSSSAKAP